jgi:hypothetical protein
MAQSVTYRRENNRLSQYFQFLNFISKKYCGVLRATELTPSGSGASRKDFMAAFYKQRLIRKTDTRWASEPSCNEKLNDLCSSFILSVI